MKTPALVLLCLLAPNIASAQLYKWIGPDGKVNYTDTPPPKNARAVDTRPAPANGRDTVALPYALQQVSAAHPVVLYTMQDCAPCDDGRRLLAARGVPVTEKTVTSNEDIAALRSTAGSTRLPLLAVGRQRQQGFEPGGWNSLLTAAGYPLESRLPAGWRNPAPAPLAPPRMPPEAPPPPPANPAAAAAQPAPQLESAPAGNAPPGFRF